MQTARSSVLQRLVFLRHFGLHLQFFEVGVELTQNVFYADQVLACVGQAVFGLAPALLVFAHASGFFEEQAQLFGPAFDDAGNGSLPDDGVGARPQTRSQEHVLHVAAAHRLAVDVVAAAAFARQHALD